METIGGTATAVTTQALSHTVQDVTNSTTSSNLTSSIFTTASAKQVVLAPLRFIVKLDRFLFSSLPRSAFRAARLDVVANRAAGLFRAGQAAVPQAGSAAAAGTGMAQAAGTAAATGGHWTDFFYDGFSAGANRSYWGALHYATSRWAFTCFVLALTLNRIGVYGSSRQRIVLTWNKRLALRIIPIMLFISQIHKILQAIHCQSSPDFSLYRHGDNNKYSILDWSTDGGPIHTISSSLLFWSNDKQSCDAIGMSRPDPKTRASHGSFSLLWPTFLRLSLSHLVESLSCSLQQVPVMTEVGLSVFEHSLAFAEAETMLAHTLNQKISKLANSTSTSTASAAIASPAPGESIPASGTILVITDAIQALIGPHPFNRINVPIELLIVALLSCGNSLTSHIISILGKKQRWRLPNTAFWGICYMSAFIWGFLVDSDMVRYDGVSMRPVSALLHFPTVAIVGFLPHMLIIVGIIICGIIYVIALLLTAVSLGSNPQLRKPTSLAHRLSIAHDNLQAAIQLRTINVRWYEDFYTALLRLGFSALTAASEAVFLNEGRAVEMRQFTWVEEDRLDDIDASRSLQSSDLAHFQIVEQYGLPHRSLDGEDPQTGTWQSGYERERKLEKKSKDSVMQDRDSFIYPNPSSDGVGAVQRTTRFFLLLIFVRGIFFTVAGWAAYGIGILLDRVGITSRPRWLRRVVGVSLKQAANDRARMHTLEEDKRFDEWNAQRRSSDKSMAKDVDIEQEMRREIAAEGHDKPEEALEEKMYEWWKSGGWYGNRDESGDFTVTATEQDEDATSVITTSTAADHSDNSMWDSESDGQRTPTQRRYSSTWSFSGIRRRRSETLASEAPILDASTLARLLNPPDKASREEARILSSHLTSGNDIMTRSRYQRQYEDDRSKILFAGRPPPSVNIADSTAASVGTRRPLTREEEADALEQLLLARRTQRSRAHGNAGQQGPDLTNAATEDSSSTVSGTPCVVCQVEARTIIAWPCRCLTVCEDCRVNLAMNNFGNCVTCRRTVDGFVRLYVP